jgi:hypothetical protein
VPAVYETEDGGATWKTIGPYWNFGFDCFDPSVPDGGCPPTTHPDQRSIAIYGGTVFVGNDGGVYTRPLDPARSGEDAAGHAAGLRTLQYYSASTGRDPNHRGYLVAGGLQDNGGSLLRAGARKQVSPFGGDGGDIIVNPRNGCQILNEYTFLVLWLTKNCGVSQGQPGSIFDVTVPDINARFTAPFRVVRGSKNIGDGASERWVATGEPGAVAVGLAAPGCDVGVLGRIGRRGRVGDGVHPDDQPQAGRVQRVLRLPPVVSVGRGLCRGIAEAVVVAPERVATWASPPTGAAPGPNST